MNEKTPMIPTWDFYNPTEIVFGKPFPAVLSAHVKKINALYITSEGATRRGLTAKAKAFFASEGIAFQIMDCATPNPSFEDLEKCKKQLVNFRPAQIISLGGGSVIDLGKIFSYVLSEDAPTLPEILKLLTQGKSLPNVHVVPFIAIPTTAGTGSEVTPFSTIWDMVQKKKYSMVARNLFPKTAILSPELTLTLPWDVTLSTGLDAFSQSLESVWNKNYTPLTGVFAARAIRLIFDELPKLKNNPKNLEARTNMMETSLLGGLCISKTRTAMAHSISYPLTAHFGTPHGIACSFTLPELCEYNFQADDGRMKTLCDDIGVDPKKFPEKIMKFMKELDFSNELKKTITDIPSVTKLSGEMYTPGRSDNNLKDFTPEILPAFIERCLKTWL